MPMLALSSSSRSPRLERLSHGRQQAASGDRRVARLGEFLEQDREVVAAEACDGVSRPHRRRQTTRRLLKQVVPGVVTEALVDRLETVDVADEDRKLLLRATRASERVVKTIHEQLAIR